MNTFLIENQWVTCERSELFKINTAEFRLPLIYFYALCVNTENT